MTSRSLNMHLSRRVFLKGGTVAAAGLLPGEGWPAATMATSGTITDQLTYEAVSIISIGFWECASFLGWSVFLTAVVVYRLIEKRPSQF